MKERKVLKATEGMILTDGVNFGRQVHLADNVDESSWYEITEEEYKKITEQEEEIV